MKILRHSFVPCALFSLLFLSLDTAQAQSLPPSAYIFVEVSDTQGKAIQEATVKVSTEGGRDFVHSNTDEAGVLKSDFYMWGYDHHYNLKVSKPGYLPYEQVFFTYPAGHSRHFASRVDEISNSLEDLKSSETSPVKIVLRKEPVTAEERRAVEAEERKHQLILAAKRGDAGGLRKLLAAGVPANTSDVKGVPAIAWAALAGEAETIKLLLDAGADLRNKSRPGHQALLIYLSEGIWREHRIKRPENYTTGETAETILARHHEVVRRLIEAGAGVNLPQSYRGSVLNTAIALLPRLHSMASQYSLSIETIKVLMAAGARAKDVDGKGQTPLMVAAQTGSLELVNLLLKAGARSNINAKDKKGWTALMYAVPPNDGAIAAEVVKVLIASGANVNAVNEEGQTALMLTAKGGSIDVVQLLLKSGASVHIKDKKGQTALMYSSQAAYFRQPFNAEISRLLIRAGASVNEKDAEGRTALMYASKPVTAHSADVARVLIQEGASVNEKDLKGWTALMYASPRHYNDSASEVARVLIEAKADVNAANEDGETALMLASHWYDYQTIKMLLAAGASITARDKKGQTVLMHACQSDTPIDIQLFLNAGAAAQVNEKDTRGWTALMYAASRYYASEDSKALIAAGADVNAVNMDGQTALMLAAATGSIELIKTLLEAGAGASINFKDKQGRTALMYVKPKYPGDSVEEIVQTLKAAGAIAKRYHATHSEPILHFSESSG